MVVVPLLFLRFGYFLFGSVAEEGGERIAAVGAFEALWYAVNLLLAAYGVYTLARPRGAAMIEVDASEGRPGRGPAKGRGAEPGGERAVDARWLVECRDCRYWVPLGSGRKGLCRRKAPVPLPWTPRSPFSVSLAPCWPVTERGDFCGEAVRKWSEP